MLYANSEGRDQTAHAQSDLGLRCLNIAYRIRDDFANWASNLHQICVCRQRLYIIYDDERINIYTLIPDVD